MATGNAISTRWKQYCTVLGAHHQLSFDRDKLGVVKELTKIGAAAVEPAIAGPEDVLTGLRGLGTSGSFTKQSPLWQLPRDFFS